MLLKEQLAKAKDEQDAAHQQQEPQWTRG